MQFKQTPAQNKERSPERNREVLFYGTLASGEKVFDRYKSHLHEADNLSDLLPTALSKINPRSEDFYIDTVAFEKEIGFKTCVETTETDEIVYAQRIGRSGLTRFVKNRKAEPSSEITVILKKAQEGYIIISAFIGGKAEKEPWDKFADEKAISFWKNHALVWGTENIVPGTETSTCPWQANKE